MRYMIYATVRPLYSDENYRLIKYPSSDPLIHNHNVKLQADGYEVLEVSASEWGKEPDENRNTEQAAGSSDRPSENDDTA